MLIDKLSRQYSAFALLLLIVLPSVAAQGLRVTDDEGRELRLTAPAERIVSLAPHLTENLFAVGAGRQIKGATSFSDYPEAAANIPRVGGYSRIDIESILALEPDLIVAWASGNDRGQVQRLIELGLPVYISEPRNFEGIAHTLERLGQLSGNAAQGAEAAADLRDGAAHLAERYAGAEPVTVFYQVWEQPLMTVNDEHLINEAISLCGGDNVFGHLDNLVPRIDRESVLQANPEVIVAGGMGEDRRDWVDAWRQWPELRAVRNEALLFIPPSLIQRHTARVLEGATRLCTHLERVRARRDAVR